MDSRENQRFVFQTKAQVKFKGLNVVECESENLSMTGVLVDKIENITLGDTCKLNIIIESRTSNLLVKMDAEVVRFTGEKMALNFIAIDDDTLYHLKNIVSYNTGILENK